MSANTYWGVDSYSQVDRQVRVPRAHYREGESGVVRESAFDYVVRRAGQQPKFWGRYLNRNLGNRLRPHEHAFLAARGCRLLPVYNGLRGAPQGRQAGHAGGVHHAEQAITIAGRLGVPSGVRLYLDLEGWRVRPDFIAGWMERMYDSRFAGSGGIYGRGAEVRVRRGRGYSYQPATTDGVRSSGWARRMADAETRASQHQASTSQPPGLGKNAACYIWTNTPRRVGEMPHRAPIFPERFAGIGPVGAESQTMIWQYRMGTFRPHDSDRGLVDLDLARHKAYEEMWE